MRPRFTPEAVAYAAAVVAALVPVWSAAVFPSQDGASHLYNAHVLEALLTGDDPAGYAAVYELNITGLANWADHLLLALLEAVVDPVVAEKLLLSTYIVLFALAARYAAGAMRPGNEWIAHLALPLIFTFSVHMGFYNFILCFPLYIALLGFFWRHRGSHRVGTLAVFLLCLYLLHPLAWLFGVFSLTMMILANARSDGAHGHTSPGTTARRLLRVWLAALPGALLLLVLVGNEPVDAAAWQPVPALLRHIYFGGLVWTFSPVDTAFGAALFLLFAAVSVAAWRRATAGDASNALAWTTGAYLVLLLVLPSQWKSLGLITERVGTFAFFTWMVALAGYAYSPRVRKVVVVAAQVLAVLLVLRWTVAVQALQPYVAEYLSVAPQLEPGSRVLELNFAPRGRGPEGQRLSHPVAPFAHTLGLVAIERDLVLLNDYEALTSVFPVRHRSAAANRLSTTLNDPPDFRVADLDAFERATCRSIDFIVTWQAEEDDPHTSMLLRSLRDRYVPRYVSQPGGHATVHQRQGPPPCG